VNDTFTALTCLDWISSGLSRISGRDFSERVYRDDEGRIRLIGADWSYPKMVNRAFDKIRQAARGMPAVIIRMLDSLNAVVDATTTASQREVLLRQGEMIVEGSQDSVNDQNDLNDILCTSIDWPKASKSEIVRARRDVTEAATSPTPSVSNDPQLNPTTWIG